MEAKVMTGGGEQTRRERERDVANRYFELPRMRGWKQMKK